MTIASLRTPPPNLSTSEVIGQLAKLGVSLDVQSDSALQKLGVEALRKLGRCLEAHEDVLRTAVKTGAISPAQLIVVEKIESFLTAKRQQDATDLKITQVASELQAKGYDLPALVAVLAHGLLKSGARAFLGDNLISRTGLVDSCGKHTVGNERANAVIDMLLADRLLHASRDSTGVGVAVVSHLDDSIPAPLRQFVQLLGSTTNPNTLL